MNFGLIKLVLLVPSLFWLVYSAMHDSPIYLGLRTTSLSFFCLRPRRRECIIEYQGTGKDRQFLLEWKDNAMPAWHDMSEIPNCKGLISEYLKKVKEGNLQQSKPLTRALKDNPSHAMQFTSIPSRRSKLLARALQNGSITLIRNPWVKAFALKKLGKLTS